MRVGVLLDLQCGADLEVGVVPVSAVMKCQSRAAGAERTSAARYATQRRSAPRTLRYQRKAGQ